MSKICVDAGHGGNDVGAACNGRYERDDTLRMALALSEALNAQGVETVMPRTDINDIGISERCRIANNAKCDYYLSIHRNACNGSASGDEIWIYSGADDSHVQKAQALLDAVCSVDGLSNRGVHKGAPNYSDFGVNKQTNMPSALIELGFIDNGGDNAAFDGHFSEIANALCAALCSIVGADYSAQENTQSAEEAPQEAPQSEPQTSTADGSVRDWQNAAIADGFRFPKYGADGYWGSECESVAKAALIKNRGASDYRYRNLTKIVQSKLGVAVDGKCGVNTANAIKSFQANFGLVADGIVGLNTWKRLLGV